MNNIFYFTEIIRNDKMGKSHLVLYTKIMKERKQIRLIKFLLKEELVML